MKFILFFALAGIVFANDAFENDADVGYDTPAEEEALPAFDDHHEEDPAPQNFEGLVGDQNLANIPEGFQQLPLNGLNVPQDFNSNQGLNLPQGFNLPQGVNLPQGFNLPEGISLAQGLQLAQGLNLQQGANFPAGLLPQAYAAPLPVPIENAQFSLPDELSIPAEISPCGVTPCAEVRTAPTIVHQQPSVFLQAAPIIRTYGVLAPYTPCCCRKKHRRSCGSPCKRHGNTCGGGGAGGILGGGRLG